MAIVAQLIVRTCQTSWMGSRREPPSNRSAEQEHSEILKAAFQGLPEIAGHMHESTTRHVLNDRLLGRKLMPVTTLIGLHARPRELQQASSF